MWMFCCINLKTADEKRRFPLSESQDTQSLAETWLIWYKIKT